MDDSISRQAAIDALKNICSEDENGITVSRANVDSMLQVLPSAQQNRLERAVAGNSPEEIYDFLYWLMFDYARTFTDSRAAVIVWLKGENDGRSDKQTGGD